MNWEDHFERIVDENYEALYRFAISLTRNESDAADLAQQTFYIWAGKGHQLREGEKAKSWLFTTTYRSFLLSRRQQWRFTNDEFDDAAATLETEPVKPCDWPEALSALTQLNEMFRAPLTLYYLEDFNYAEIAETLRMPLGTVKSRIARGISQLRTILLDENSEFRAASPKPDLETIQERDLSIAH